MVLFAYPSFNHSAQLKGVHKIGIEKLSKTIDTLNPFEDKRDYFATSIMSESVNLQFDSEGRVLLPEKMCLKHAKIKKGCFICRARKNFSDLGTNDSLKNLRLFARKKAYKNRCKP